MSVLYDYILGRIRLKGKDEQVGTVTSVGAGTGISDSGTPTDPILNHDAHTGDATGATALTIALNAVDNAKAADLPALSMKGNDTAILADPQDLTVPEVLALLDIYTQTEVNNLLDASLKVPEAYNSAGSGNFPVTYDGSAVEKGDTFRIVTADTLGTGTIVNPEDLLIANLDAPGQTDANWQVVESNRDQATETIKGVAEIATQVEVDTGTDDERIVTPLKLAASALASDVSGNTAARHDAVTLGASAPTAEALSLAGQILSILAASATNRGVAETATQAEVDAGTDPLRYVTPATLSQSTNLPAATDNNFVYSFDTTTQNIAVVNAWQDYTFNTDVVIQDFLRPTVSEFKAAKAGTYLITADFSYNRTGGGGATNFAVHAVKNGVEVAGSHMGLNIQANNTVFKTAKTFVITMAVDDILKIQIASGSLNVQSTPGPDPVGGSTAVSGSIAIRQ